MKITDDFRNAEALAAFANIDSTNLDPNHPQNVDNFRHNYPDFVPETWWDYQPTDHNGMRLPLKQWELNQKWLRDAWRKGFGIILSENIKLLTSVFDPNDLWEVQFEKEFGFLSKAPRAHIHPSLATVDEIGDWWPYHRAVTYLCGKNSWRSKICADSTDSNCKKYFVANASQHDYCHYTIVHGESCKDRNRKKSNLGTWHRNKKKYRPSGKKTNRTTKRPVSRNKRASKTVH